ncbi:MAG TPA: YciI family protein [Polyangia bacterium]|jgi:hypothetical protein|nr:YciI family protein [Polyangia bacterium]
MRFMMLMYPSEQAEQGVMPEPALVQEMMKYNEELAKAGVLLSLDGLHPSAKGVRITWNAQGKPVVTDGPFSEATGILGGYWLLQAKSREEAIEWAKRVPSRGARKVELRQIFEMTDFPSEVRNDANVRATVELIEKQARS